jgi:hypothetical protein
MVVVGGRERMSHGTVVLRNIYGNLNDVTLLHRVKCVLRRPFCVYLPQHTESYPDTCLPSTEPTPTPHTSPTPSRKEKPPDYERNVEKFDVTILPVLPLIRVPSVYANRSQIAQITIIPEGHRRLDHFWPWKRDWRILRARSRKRARSFAPRLKVRDKTLQSRFF